MEITEKPKIIIENKNSIFNYFAWPTVARLPGGVLAVVCSGFRMRHICPFGKLVISYSCTEGESWTRPAPLIDTPLDDRDGGIMVGKDKVIATSFNNTAEFQRRIIGSREGKSAELIKAYIARIPEDAEEKYLGSQYVISRDGGYTFEDIKRSPVTSPHGPCELSDGRILWVGRIFSGDDSPSEVLCCELDENENFVPISKIAPCEDEYGVGYACEPHAIELPNGDIFVAIRVQRGGENPLFTVYTCRSCDGGHTFSTPKMIIGREAGSPPHLLLHSSGALIMTYACRKDNCGIRAVIFGDCGETFSEEIKLTENAGSADLGYPSSVELSGGEILTVYYENDGDHATIRQIKWKM